MATGKFVSPEVSICFCFACLRSCFSPKSNPSAVSVEDDAVKAVNKAMKRRKANTACVPLVHFSSTLRTYLFRPQTRVWEMIREWSVEARNRNKTKKRESSEKTCSECVINDRKWWKMTEKFLSPLFRESDFHRRCLLPGLHGSEPIKNRQIDALMEPSLGTHCPLYWWQLI